MLLNKFSEQELRNSSRETLETLEYWLRTVIDKKLSDAYGSDYLNAKDDKGNKILSKAIADKIISQYATDPLRYTRFIDASLLDSLIDIICNPNLYKKHFEKVFSEAFPDGNCEARTFFRRLIVPRNHLSHANPISIRQAEQILCYSNDIISSINRYSDESTPVFRTKVPHLFRSKVRQPDRPSITTMKA